MTIKIINATSSMKIIIEGVWQYKIEKICKEEILIVNPLYGDIKTFRIEENDEIFID